MRSLRVLTAAACAAVAVACGGAPEPAPEPTAETVALTLLRASASAPAPRFEELEPWFPSFDDESDRADWIDAVRAILPGTEPRVVGRFTVDEEASAGFDLECDLPGGGFARYSVLVDTTEPPGRIVWFSGPGVEWPDRRRRGDGLSTSAPPAPGEGG